MLTWLKNIPSKMWTSLCSGVGYVIGPIDPHREDAFQKATRFKLALGVSIVLSAAFIVAFAHALSTDNILRVEEFLDFAKAICISLVSMVGVYLGARSIRGRGPYGGTLGSFMNSYKGAPEDEVEEDAVQPPGFRQYGDFLPPPEDDSMEVDQTK